MKLFYQISSYITQTIGTKSEAIVQPQFTITVWLTSRGRPEVSCKWLHRFDFRIFLLNISCLSERCENSEILSWRSRFVDCTILKVIDLD